MIENFGSRSVGEALFGYRRFQQRTLETDFGSFREIGCGNRRLVSELRPEGASWLRKLVQLEALKS